MDVTRKVTRYIKYTLVSVLLASAAIGFGIWHVQHVEDELTISNAKVAGTLVSVRVLTDGSVRELTHADGDQVQAGDVIAKLEVSITEEQLAQLEESVELARENYEQLQMGQTVQVEVRTPKPRTVVIPQPTQQIVHEAPAVDLSALAERRDRMEKLYEMGAISRVQRDAAIAEYEMAQYEASQPIIEEYEPEPIIETEMDYEIEYVEQFQPTPPEILEGAQMAIRQAEMSLNTARQEAQQTEVIAPVSGTIYYAVAAEQSLEAGMPIAKIGDSNELWLEAEVTEDQFYRITLGKLVSYVLNGQTFNGTVIEKLAPLEYSVGGPLLLAENDPIETPIDPINQNDPIEQSTPSEPTGQAEENNPTAQSSGQSDRNINSTDGTLDYTQVVDAPFDGSSFENNVEYEPPPKFVVKFSLPSERDFECRPNMSTNVTVHDPLISWRWIKPMYWDLLARLRGQH